MTAVNGSGHWSVSDIPYDAIDREQIKRNPDLLYLVTAASFIEITSDLYTRSLVAYFEGDPPVQRWLAERWEWEELQHGEALKRYVQAAWPELDWEGAYRGFYADYAPLCAVSSLGPTRALELAARCVVETGTSTYYSMLAEASPEPVLGGIAARIARDEQRHYNLFHYHFRRWAAKEGTTRRDVLKALWGRVREVDQEDIYYAYKHAFHAQHPDREFTDALYTKLRSQYVPMARRHYPYRRAAKMLVQPLRLDPPLQAAATALVAGGAWMFLF
jgi:hypothetical protein